MDFVRPSELALHGNVAENWRRFKQRLMLYLEATEKATKPDKLKVAILLNFIGEEALEVFNTFHLKEDEAENFDLVINKFDDFCEPKKNVIFERFKFFSATQKDGESIDSFITELKGLSTSCEYESQKDSLIRDRIVYGIQDKALQERLLREPNLTLLKAIEMCKTDEISKQQIKIMQNNQNICQIRKYEKKHSPKQNQESEKEFKCQRCGKSHRAKNCPAWGKRCSKCKKMNHFAAFCKSSAIRSLNDETEETVWSIHEAKVVHTLEWKKSIIVNGKEICFKLDSGAEVNVLPYTFTRQMKGLEIFQTNRKLTSYTGHEIKIKGIATLNCKTKNKTESLEFFIADGYYQPILGIEAIEKLSLIKKCDAVQTEQNNSAKEILNRHKNIFEGIGRLPIEHKIRLKENATPVIAPSRKIPFSIREKVKAELERMEKLDIIEKVEEPSEWTHPIVVVQKPSGDVRICMDHRELNKYVQRERYILPTAETIFSELKGATVFSVFDASSAFWHVPLDKESTNLCTIATPFGRFRFKRLPYGLNSASEVFQRCINNILSGLPGTACYMDDILIYGSTMEEHNRNLETVLRRLEENNVKLNAKKQQIAVDKVNFLGHIISRDGITIQASRAEAIQKLKRPENKTEVQRFLGMVTYLGKFIPNLSDKTAPLRKLISNKSEWKFGGEEIDCFKKLKDMVSNAPILTFFDPTKPITISSDASQYGIGTVLMQGGHAIEYASFSLNATQRKYAQIEKELLAIVFGCERFQYYIWGNDVIVETDHKPLLSIVKKPLEKLSPRLQRMVLRLMRFQISLKFTPGKNMFVADHLSRDPLKDDVDTSYLEGQTESVHMLLVTTDEKIKRLQKETHGDHTLIQLIEYAKNGWPKYKTMVCDEAKPYWQFQDEIHVSDGIVYKGNCIMVPSTLRKEILQVVHSSHQGIAASKEKARSAFYWPGMITQVENEVEKCRTCQEYSRKNPEESRIAHEIPEFPWEKIAVDFMEVSGTSSILVVDYHSKFVEIRKLSSKRETETIMQLKTIFRTHGIPRTLVSDNGPPFNSTGFKNFAQKYEFKHQTSSPKYPRSNGQVERTIQTIKGLIIKAVKSGRDPNLALMEFNNTPKYDLPSPTQMLMGRSVRTLSTYTRQQLKPLFDTTKNYQKLRDHQQKYAGSPKRILRPLEVGDNIMLQERHRKWVPATVTAKHETPRSYMVKTPSGSEYRRNRSHLRPRKFSVEDSAPTSQSPSIPGSQAGTAMDDNIQDHGRPTSENRRAYDPREDIAKKGEESSTSPSVRTRSGRTGSFRLRLMIIFEEVDVFTIKTRCCCFPLAFNTSSTLRRTPAMDSCKKKKADKPSQPSVDIAALVEEDNMVISRHYQILQSLGQPSLAALHLDLVRFIEQRTEIIKCLVRDVNNLTGTVNDFMELDEIIDAQMPKKTCQTTQASPAPTCKDSSAQTELIKPATPAPAAVPVAEPATKKPDAALTRRKQPEASNPPAKRSKPLVPVKPASSRAPKPAVAKGTLNGEKSRRELSFTVSTPHVYTWRNSIRIAIGNLPFFVGDAAVMDALSRYGRITSIAPKQLRVGEFDFTDGRREAFILLHDGITVEMLPSRFELRIKGEPWPAFLTHGIKCSKCRGQGHRRANCPQLHGRPTTSRRASPPPSTSLPPSTAPGLPRRTSAAPPAPAPPSPAMEVYGAPHVARAVLHPSAPRPYPPAAPAIPMEETPSAPPPVTPAPPLQAPEGPVGPRPANSQHPEPPPARPEFVAPRDPLPAQKTLGPAAPTPDVEMSIVEETSASSTSSAKNATRHDLDAFIERHPSVSFAGTDALGLGREEVLDLLSSRTKAQRNGPLLSPPQCDALAGLIRQILDLRPGAASNLYKVLGQVKAELRTTPAAVPPTPPLPAPRPAEPMPPTTHREELTLPSMTPPPPAQTDMEEDDPMTEEALPAPRLAEPTPPALHMSTHVYLGQVKAELRTTPAGPPTPPLPAPRPSGPTPPTSHSEELMPAVMTPPPPALTEMEEDNPITEKELCAPPPPAPRLAEPTPPAPQGEEVTPAMATPPPPLPFLLQINSSMNSKENQRYANSPNRGKDANSAAPSTSETLSSNGAAQAQRSWADITEDASPESDNGYTIVQSRKRRRGPADSPTAAAHTSNVIRGTGANLRPRSSTGRVPRAQEIRTTRAHIVEARARQASSNEDQCVYIERCPELEPYHYLSAIDRVGGTVGVIQISKMNGHFLVGLPNRALADRLVSEGLEVEGTLFRAFPFRKRAEKITVGNLPFFVEDSAIISALRPYGRVTSIAPKLMKAGPYIYNDGRREAFIALHEGVTTERLPTRLDITIKGEAWPAYLSSGIKCSRCRGQGHRRANCPLLAGLANKTRLAPPTTPAAVPSTTTSAPPQRSASQPPTPASSSPARETPGTSPAARAVTTYTAPRPSPPVAPAVPMEEAPSAPPPVTPAPSLQAPEGPVGPRPANSQHPEPAPPARPDFVAPRNLLPAQKTLRPAAPTPDVEMSIVEETSASSTSSAKNATRIDLDAFIERHPSVSFAGTDALGLGRKEVLDLLSSRTKAQRNGPLLSPP
ncbi:K02A2.6-like, partial [Cordylochernes scorpioides]